MRGRRVQALGEGGGAGGKEQHGLCGCGDAPAPKEMSGGRRLQAGFMIFRFSLKGGGRAGPKGPQACCLMVHGSVRGGPGQQMAHGLARVALQQVGNVDGAGVCVASLPA